MENSASAQGQSASSMTAEGFAAGYNPFISPQLDEPYPTYAACRRDAPVFFSPVLGVWVVSRYADVVSVLKNPKVFASADMLKNHYAPVPEAASVLEKGGYARMPLTVDNDDPTCHSRIRSAVMRSFSPRRIATIEPGVRSIANELIDGFIADRAVDFTARFAVPFR